MYARSATAPPKAKQLTDSYFDDIRTLEPLTADAEKTATVEQLVIHNTWFAVDQAKRFLGRGVALPDLIQAANMGLVEAARRFDPGRDVKFITYAVWWIRQQIRRVVTSEDKLIYVPTHIPKEVNMVARTDHAMSQAQGRAIHHQELYEQVEMTKDTFGLCLSLMQAPISLEREMIHDGCEGARPLDILTYPDAVAPDERVEQAERQEILQRLLQVLPEREADMVQMYYVDGLTLKEIGEEHKLTRERVRQLIANALDKMRRRCLRDKVTVAL
jgi:RNA polymerase primary sigma factor